MEIGNCIIKSFSEYSYQTLPAHLRSDYANWIGKPDRFIIKWPNYPEQACTLSDLVSTVPWAVPRTLEDALNTLRANGAGNLLQANGTCWTYRASDDILQDGDKTVVLTLKMVCNTDKVWYAV